MGILDLFKSKEEQPSANRRLQAMHGHVSEAFSHLHGQVTALHQEVQKQQEWLKYVHSNHLSLNTQHGDHKELTKNEVTRVNSWITFLHKAVQKQEKQLAHVQKSIEDSTKNVEKNIALLYQSMEKVHKKASEKPAPQLIEKEINHDEVAQKVLQSLNLDLEGMKAQVRQEVYSSLAASLQEEQEKHKQSVQEMLSGLQQEQESDYEEETVALQSVVAPQQPHIVQHSYEQAPSWSMQLTNPEQKLLNLLMSEADPLTYTKISQLTGHSINTIRVNMNILKKKNLVEESTLPSGVKLFSVSNKEKVKKMYNVQVL